MSFEEKLRACGEKGDNEGLRELIVECALEELLDLVEKRISDPNFTFTWDYTLKGFDESSDCHKTRFEVVLRVLKLLESRDAKSDCYSIIDRICMEVSKFKSQHLIRICDFCMECLQVQRTANMCWRKFLPEVLKEISEREQIQYNEEEMSGSAFTHQFIKAIIALQWFPSNVCSVAEMFSEMTLTKEEHKQLVNKLTKYFEKLTPREIPPFVNQLLRLCERDNGRLVFAKLQQYFTLRYKNVESNSDSTDIDVIEDASDHNNSEVESAVLLIIHTVASSVQDSIKDYLTFIKGVLRSPEFVLNPFQLNVLFTLSTISNFDEMKMFEIVRSCISRMYHEDLKKSSSAWFRDMVPTSNNIEEVFVQVIDSGCQDRELVLQGLINFAIVLLGVGAGLGKDVVAERQWRLGNMILFKIIKRKRHTAPVIIEQLTERIITESSVVQYIECLYMMSKSLSLLMLENKSLVISLMEGLFQMTGKHAAQLLDAIIPLTKVSPTIRDHFILILRKALQSRSTETRQVAVIGFLKLLTNLKISHLAIVSQSSFSGSYHSGHSLYTQISLTQTAHSLPSVFSNEAICLEVLSILERSFMQQAEVRVQLYKGLYNAVCLNPELGIPILKMLWIHFLKFYNIDEETLPPFNFDKITKTIDVTVFLQEPLGNLVYSIGLIVVEASKTSPENAIVVKFAETLASVCTRMINSELVHFNLDDGTDLSDVIPEAQQKLLILKEALSVYEALIAYKFQSWQLDTETNGTEISRLFEGHCRLANLLKTINKPKKADKKKDANKTTQTNNTTIKRDGQKSSKTIKAPTTVMDLQVIIKILQLLFDPLVPWTTKGQANIVKAKKEFFQHTMQAGLHLISSVKNKKIIDVEVARKTYEHLRDVATILYQNVIKHLAKIIDFDCLTAILGLECFLGILQTVVGNFGSNCRGFFARVGGTDSEDVAAQLSDFCDTYQKLFEMDEEELSEDPEIKRLSLVVINTLSFLVTQIPSSPLSAKMMEWLKTYATSNTVQSKPVAQVFVNLLLECHIKFKVSSKLFEHVAVRIGDVTGVMDEEEHDIEELKVIKEQTVSNAFVSLCNNIKSILEDTEWVIARLRAEFATINYPDEEGLERRLEDLRNRERGLCCQMCFVVNILTHLSNCTIPSGPMSEAILKNLSLLYVTLASLTKYFVSRSSKISLVFQNARFERLVQLAGKQLAPIVSKFITYFEESQKQSAESAELPKKSKRKNVDPSSLKNKVLKETRLIPKVVHDIEQFSKFVMQLSKKTNVDLQKFIGMSTTRDFRIVRINEVLEENDGGTQRTQESGASEESDRSCEEASPPPSKKKKV